MAVSPDVKSVTPHEALSRLYSPSPAFYLNPDQTISAVNKTAKWLFDASAESLFGLPFRALYAGERRVGMSSRSSVQYMDTHLLALEQTKAEKNFTHYPFNMIDPAPNRNVLQRYNAWMVNLEEFGGLGSVIELRPDRIYDRFGKHEYPLDNYHDDLARRDRLGDEKVQYVDTANDQVEKILSEHQPHQIWQKKECGLHVITEIGSVNQKVWTNEEVDAEAARIKQAADNELAALMNFFPVDSEDLSQMKTFTQIETDELIQQLSGHTIPKRFLPRSVNYDRLTNNRILNNEEWWSRIKPLYS